MNLNVDSWKEFYISDCEQHSGLFKIENCKCGCAGDLEDGNDINYIGAKKNENGVMKKVVRDERLVSKGNGIIFICDGEGSVGYTNYIQEDFIGSTTLSIGYNENLNSINALFIVTVLDKEKYKFSYGRKYRAHINDIKIKLPTTSDGNPDWGFMECYIKSLKYEPITTKNKDHNKTSLNTNEWKEFVLSKVFTLKGGFYNKKPEHSIEGKIPFLASTENNNGVTELYSIEDIYQWDKVGNEDFTLDKKLYDGNSIAVTVNGSVCNAFYQREQFACSHDITALYLNGYELNIYLAKFLCTVIMLDKYRWSYGRKPHDVKKFGKSIIKLPIKRNANGSPCIDKYKLYSKEGYIPDWEFMENYIKSLPYGDKL